jgi:hypothetical protein
MQANRNGCTGSASASNDQDTPYCQCCGRDVPEGQEARHDMGAGVYCLTCERVHVNGDLDAAAAAIEMIEATIKAAIFGGHLNAEDAAAAVARIAALHPGEQTSTIAELQHDIHVNNERMGLLERTKEG